ncbi:MAG: hypothetical protein CL528_11445 [Aequorivita sp.]|nr:hypothetical protein [Aequorivita sp.]MBP42381.1 hypothetical protein [Aequorivita sp.]|tara:strand:- start:4325 stop:4657 length:333 start_codon:yes stop_codon:yes gene_type:complete
MTLREKYQQNENLIKGYTDFLLKHSYKNYKQNARLCKPITRAAENKLIEEIARLREENKNIRIDAIVEPQILKNEYPTATIATVSKLTHTHLLGFYASKPKSLEHHLELS